MKGYMMFARGKDYVQQACMCAMSPKATQEISLNVSIVTDDTIPASIKDFLILFLMYLRDDNTFTGPTSGVFPSTPTKKLLY